MNLGLNIDYKYMDELETKNLWYLDILSEPDVRKEIHKDILEDDQTDCYDYDRIE